ncbi:MAG TPA: hypothetical protein VL882_25715 [Vicinamibacterales bacterium]|nr:hypothetical protein [Vicinamibacterales bacterium]
MTCRVQFPSPACSNHSTPQECPIVVKMSTRLSPFISRTNIYPYSDGAGGRTAEASADAQVVPIWFHVVA